MKIVNRALLLTLTLAAATAACAQDASKQDKFFDQQRQITDGYYPVYQVTVPLGRADEGSEATQAENAWLEAERASDSNGSRPVPFGPIEQAVAAAHANQNETLAASGR